MDERKINPCPKCGGNPELHHYDDDCYYVCCSECMIHTFLVHKATNAVDEWQNRHVIDSWLKKTGERVNIK